MDKVHIATDIPKDFNLQYPYQIKKEGILKIQNTLFFLFKLILSVRYDLMILPIMDDS